MQADHSQTGLIHSTLDDLETFGEILNNFLAVLPRRIEQIEDLLKAADFQQVAHLAHQLKGAGGGYGFPGLSARAAALETHAKASPPSAEMLADSVRDLRDYQSRLRS